MYCTNELYLFCLSSTKANFGSKMIKGKIQFDVKEGKPVNIFMSIINHFLVKYGPENVISFEL